MLSSINEGLESDNPIPVVDIFQSVLFSIRNVQRLSHVQLNYLYLCSVEQLIQIIEGYNNLIDYLIDVIMLDDFR